MVYGDSGRGHKLWFSTVTVHPSFRLDQSLPTVAKYYQALQVCTAGPTSDGVRAEPATLLLHLGRGTEYADGAVAVSGGVKPADNCTPSEQGRSKVIRDPDETAYGESYTMGGQGL